MKNSKKIAFVVLAAVMLVSVLIPSVAFAEDASTIEYQPYGKILNNSADDFNDFTNFVGMFSDGFTFESGVNINPSAGADKGFYANQEYHNGYGNKLGDGIKTTNDIPNPWLIWQVAKDSKVDIVTYEHSSVINTPDNPLVKFSVSKDMVNWTDIDNANVTKTEVTDANKTAMGLDDIYTGAQLGGYGITNDYEFTMPEDYIFVKATINMKEQPNNYAFCLTKLRARDGVSIPDKMEFTTEHVYSAVMGENTAKLEDFSEEAFDVTQLFNTKTHMSLTYEFVNGKASFEKPYVVYKVSDDSHFVVKTSMFYKALRMGFDFKLYTSADKTTWTEAEAIATLEPLSTVVPVDAYKNYHIIVPKNHYYVKIEYPQNKDYSGNSFNYMVAKDSDQLHYAAGLVSVKFKDYTEKQPDEKPEEKPKPNTTVTFTGTDADLKNFVDYNKKAIDLSQKISGKTAIMIVYDYLLGKTEADPLFMTFKVAEKSPFIAKIFIHGRIEALQLSPKFFVSADNNTWTEVTATVANIADSGTPGFSDYTFSIEEIPAGNKYVKILYPQTKDFSNEELYGNKIGDPLNYGIALYEVQYLAEKSPTTGVADSNIIPLLMIISIISLASLFFVYKTKLS